MCRFKFTFLLFLSLFFCSVSFLFADELELQIFHVNDTHAALSGLTDNLTPGYNEKNCIGGFARISYEIKAAKAKNDNVIALDAGDRFQKSLFFSLFRWSPIAEVNKKIPWDAAVLGNHEFDDGCEALSDFLKEIPHPVLAANLKTDKSCPLSGCSLPPYVVLNIRSTPVAVIGLTTVLKGFTRPCSHMKLEAPEKVLSREIDKLQEIGIKHIIVLTHLGFKADKELARNVKGIDIIVGGHSHTYIGEGSKNGPYPVVEHSPEGKPVLIVTAKSFTQYLGKLTVRFDEEGIPVKWSGAPIMLAPNAPLDPQVHSVVQRYEKAIRTYRKDIIGRTSKISPDGAKICQNRDCFTGTIISNAMLEYGKPYGASASFLPAGSLRATFPKGKISRADLAEILWFNETCHVISLKGEALLEALTLGVSSQKKKKTRLLQAAGIRYEIDGNGKDARIVKAEIADKDGVFSGIIPDKDYVVVCSEDLIKGRNKFTMLKQSRRLSSPVSLRYITMEYLRRHSPLSPDKTERITHKK